MIIQYVIAKAGDNVFRWQYTKEMWKVTGTHRSIRKGWVQVVITMQAKVEGAMGTPPPSSKA